MKPDASTRLRAIAAIAVLTVLAGCNQVYPQSPAAARSALVGGAIPPIAFGMSAHSGPGVATADGVAWSVLLGPEEGGAPPGAGGDSEVMKLAAKLVPASGGVRVSVDIVPPERADPKVWAKALSEQPAMFRYFRSVAREQVDAVLTHRAFSFAAVSGDLALAVAANLPNIRKQLDEANAATDRYDQETMHHAYDAAGQGSE